MEINLKTCVPPFHWSHVDKWDHIWYPTAAAAAKSLSVMSDSVRPHRRQPTRLPCPWYSPGKNTGVGCHFLLQYMKVKSESEVAQSCPTLFDPMDCSPPGSSAHEIFQARVLEWGAIGLVNLNSRFTPCPFQAGLDSVSAFFLVCGSLVTQLTLRMEEWEMEPVHLKL